MGIMLLDRHEDRGVTLITAEKLDIVTVSLVLGI